MATGEWIHDYLNRSGGGNPVKRNKSVNNGQRLYVAAQGLQPPSSVDNKRNIKRSWTISSKTFLFFDKYITLLLGKILCQNIFYVKLFCSIWGFKKAFETKQAYYLHLTYYVTAILSLAPPPLHNGLKFLFSRSSVFKSCFFLMHLHYD